MIGQVLHGRYRISGLIGSGGMGAVWRAEHVETGRLVAVKTLHPKLARRPGALERFRREARSAGRLRHPNVVDVTDFGVEERAPGPGGGAARGSTAPDRIAYLVMEHLEGTTLRALLQRGSVAPDVAADIVEQISVALDEAHRAGVVHRDLKPENVWLVPDGRGGHSVRILDFGIAKLIEGDPAESPPRPAAGGAADTPADPPEDELETVRQATPGSRERWSESESPTEVHVEVLAEVRNSPGAQFDSDKPSTPDRTTEPLTVEGAVMGTPLYMSPEQCAGRAVGPQSDIYSLGVVAYELFTGRRPFRGTNAELVWRHATMPAPRADEGEGRANRAVADLLGRALAKAPEARFPTAGALAGSLRVASEGRQAVLRRVLALYIDRLGPFLAVAIRGTAPLLGPLALWLCAELALGVARRLLPRPYSSIALALAQLVSAPALLFAVPTAILMVFLLFTALTDRLRSAPLAPVDAPSILGAVREQLGLPGDAGYLRICAAGWRLLFVSFRAGGLSSGIAFQVVLHEPLRGEGLARRCAQLGAAAGTSRLAFEVSAGVLVVGMLVPLLALSGGLAYGTGLLQGVRWAHAFAQTASATVLQLAMLSLLVAMTPVAGMVECILYWRARQALGEPVGVTGIVPTRI